MKYPCIRQHSEEDCGAACLSAIARYHGRRFSISHIRELVGTGQQGTTLLGLSQGAEALGYCARSVRTSPEILNRIEEAPLPAIIHWQGYHWVVLYGRRGRRYVVADPAVGLRFLSKGELAIAWNDWVMLLLDPDPVRLYAQPNEDSNSWGRLLRRILPYTDILIEAFLCALFVGMLSLSSPFLVQILTDDVLVRGDMQLLTAVVIAVMVMNLISSSLSLVQSYLVAHFAQRFQLGMVLEFGRQILRLPLSYYEARRSGEIVSRLADIQEINQLVSQVVVSLPSQVFVGLVSLVFMLFYSVKLTIAALLVGMLMTASTFTFLPALQQKIRSTLVLEAENQGVLVESFKGALTMKTTGAMPQFWEEFQSRFSRHATNLLGTTQIGIINSVFSKFVSDMGSVGLLWLGSTLVIGQELSIGQLLSFNGMNHNFLALISLLVGLVNQYAQARTATQRLNEVVRAIPEDAGDRQRADIVLPDDTDILCSHISFHYPGRMELLEDFSLTLPGGRVIALIGQSGCGKSTLAKLIAGLYPLQSGNIRLGMYNLRDLSLECLRRQVVLVPQDAHFWSRSILENFRLGAPHLSLEQIVYACQLTDADEFISRLPDKYQTILGEFGANISGGQRQRLAIARAILHNPPILILDESTAGLDPVSEAQVLDRLLTHRRGKTTILISHRPSVIHCADWLVLLEQGRLKLQGVRSLLANQPGDHLAFLVEDPHRAAALNAELYYRQGVRALNSQQHEAAIAHFDATLQYQPTCTKACFARGLAYLSRQEPERAIADFTRALNDNPKDAEIYLSRGVAYQQLKHFQHALRDARTAAQVALSQGKMNSYERSQRLLKQLLGVKNSQPSTNVR